MTPENVKEICLYAWGGGLSPASVPSASRSTGEANG